MLQEAAVWPEIEAIAARFFQHFRGVNVWQSCILRLRTKSEFPAYCCSAVLRSSIARPPPFLGVSSLNLAAPRSGHFFCAGLLAAGCVARRSWAYAHCRSPLLLRHKIPGGENASVLRSYSAASGRSCGGRGGQRRSRVSCVSAAVRRACTASKPRLLGDACLRPDKARD